MLGRGGCFCRRPTPGHKYELHWGPVAVELDAEREVTRAALRGGSPERGVAAGRRGLVPVSHASPGAVISHGRLSNSGSHIVNDDSSDRIDRRSFAGVILGGGIAAFVAAAAYPIIRFIIPPKIAEAPLDNVVAAKADQLQPNSGVIFKFGNKPGLLIRLPSGDFKAFSAVCTHLNCTVQYRPEDKDIWCACHNGHYDLNGNVISGPPPRPLEEYAVFVRNGEVVVAKEKSS
jgi:cytochrome b6-f complex iron-sulfur subunit